MKPFIASAGIVGGFAFGWVLLTWMRRRSDGQSFVGSNVEEQVTDDQKVEERECIGSPTRCCICLSRFVPERPETPPPADETLTAAAEEEFVPAAATAEEETPLHGEAIFEFDEEYLQEEDVVEEVEEVEEEEEELAEELDRFSPAIILDCRHKFHVSCLGRWTQTAIVGKCPLCMTPI